MFRKSRERELHAVMTKRYRIVATERVVEIEESDLLKRFLKVRVSQLLIGETEGWENVVENGKLS